MIGGIYWKRTPTKIPVIKEAAPNMPATGASLLSTDLNEQETFNLNPDH